MSEAEKGDLMGCDLNADPYEFSSLEFSEAYDRALAKAAADRAAGNFPPYYVRRIGSWGAYTPAAQVYLGRWGVFYSADGVDGTAMRDLNNCRPDFCRLGTFWRFKKACRVAVVLSMAFLDGQRSTHATMEKLK